MNFYYKCADILREMEKGKSNFKTIIYKYKENRCFQKMYAITSSMIQKKDLIEKILIFLEEKNNKKIENRNLMKVLIYEEFFNPKKKKMGGKLQKIIKSSKKDIILKFNIILKDKTKKFIKNRIYFRIINSSKNSQDENIQKLINFSKQDEINKDLYFLDYKNYKEFNNKFFPLYKNNKIVIQSKSSCLPVFVLKQYFKDFENGQILESCSAPGNKTLQIYEYFPNAEIFSFELNSKRFNILKNRTDFYQENFCQEKKNFIFNENFFDFKKIGGIDKELVKAVVIDPSCSGSGMINNIDNFDDLEKMEIENSKNFEKYVNEKYEGLEKYQKDKILKLSQMQENFIQFSIKNFKNLKFIVYSTCSIYEKENENVVRNILNNNPKIELVNIFDNKWKLRGFNTKKSFPENMNFCIRENPYGKINDGFFVALFKVNHN